MINRAGVKSPAHTLEAFVEYPKMLCRDGQEIDVNGIEADTLIVENAEDETAARRDGWLSFDELANGEIQEKRPRGRPRNS